MIFGCMPLYHLSYYNPHYTDNHLTGLGAAYGTAKSGIGIAGVGTFRPDLIMKVPSLPPLSQPFSTLHTSPNVPH